MLTFTYKYIITTVIALFACASALLLLSQRGVVWYVYMVPCVLAYIILTRRTNKIGVTGEEVIIKGLFGKEVLKLEDIRHFEVFEDPFFCRKTSGVRVCFRNGDRKKYYVGTLPASQLSKLSDILNRRLDC